MWGLALLTFLTVCCIYRRIKIAIGVIKTAADYVKDTWAALLVPIFMVILLAGLYVYWITAAMYRNLSYPMSSNSNIIIVISILGVISQNVRELHSVK